MARTTWAIVDMSYCLYSCHYTTDFQEKNGVPVNAIAGFLRDLDTIMDCLNTRNLAFAFDTKPYLRNKEFPWYKLRCDQDNHMNALIRDQIKVQSIMLRDDILPSLGYRNLFWQEGYEADDIIASLVSCMDPKERAVIVSADKDLYQLLNASSAKGSVVEQTRIRHSPIHPEMYPLMTEEQFRNLFKVSPSEWPQVKAVSGCVSDRIDGVYGVGEQIAARVLAGITVKGMRFIQVKDFVKTEKYQDNLRLCTLPWKGCARYKPACHPEVDQKEFRKVCSSFGIKPSNRDALAAMWPGEE